ncbi:MAG TPA: hypothetical protein VGG19_18975 [Tepidisphaeraceae bacterium]
MGESLEYLSRDVAMQSQKPRHWWMLVAFTVGIFALEDVLTARLTPPGWPIYSDYLLMLLIPIGAVVMATTTSLPAWSIGLYGLVSACVSLGRIAGYPLALSLRHAA